MLNKSKKTIAVFGVSSLIITSLIFIGQAYSEGSFEVRRKGPKEERFLQLATNSAERPAKESGPAGSLPEQTPAQSVNGAALYSRYCTGCHGQSKRGVAASKIQNAINNNIGGMGFLGFLTPAEVDILSNF